jgi:uncharacterized protein (DUF305 family)
MRPHLWKTAAPTALIIVGSLVLASCGEDTGSGSMPGMNHSKPATGSSLSPGPAPAGDFNDADVTFASQMIPHHQQAVQMAMMGARKATAAELTKLSTAIKTAQDAEIKTLSAWLTGWGKPVPAVDHHDHSTDAMPGMMTEDEMSDLGNANGSMFDRLWARMMVEHHRGAVVMAKAEQSTGKNPAAIALAKKIEADQTREIATLQRLLDRLPTS